MLASGSVFFSEFHLGRFSPPFQRHSYFSLPLCSKTYPTRRLARIELLTIHCSMISLGRGFSNDWDMSTSKRNFKFSQEVIDVSLNILDHIEVIILQLYIKFTSGVWHGSLCPNCPPTHPKNRCAWCFSLKSWNKTFTTTIMNTGMEGRTHFVHGKTEDYPAYRPREISSARPGGRWAGCKLIRDQDIEKKMRWWIGRLAVFPNLNVFCSIVSCSLCLPPRYRPSSVTTGMAVEVKKMHF